VARLRAQLLEAIGTVGETEAARLEADAALKAWVRAQFGVESTEAIDFGFPPPRTGVPTVEEKALAVARAKATRKARHTMGKRQKEGIRGTVAVSGATAETGEGTAAVAVAATPATEGNRAASGIARTRFGALVQSPSRASI
jgi:hypothetical protein